MEKHKVIGTVIGVLAFILLVVGATYAWFTWRSPENTSVSFTVEGIEISFDAGEDILSSRLRPVLDKEKGVEDGYAIKKNITASSAEKSYLNLYLTLETLPNELKHESFKWELYKDNNLIGNGNFKDSSQGDKIIVASNQETNSTVSTYILYIWIDGNMDNLIDMGNKEFKFVLNADASEQEPDFALETLTKLGLSVSEGTPNFNNVAKTNEGIYGAEDDFGPSYYFRGSVENNYVKFAGYYWRIIRINGDGTIRIIYDGTSAHSNGEISEDRQIGTTAYNSEYGDNTYVGYMYGTTGGSIYEETHANTNSSTIKIANDNWYKTNIVDTGFSDSVTDAIYCNDRGLFSGTGVGLEVTKYQVNGRIDNNKTPSLKCNLNKDKFTTNSELGNGNLTYPVGLITADEMVFAGGKKMSTNESYYLYNGNYFWTMSPNYFNGVGAGVWSSFDDGGMSSDRVNRARGLRPVISLKSDLTFTGNGTMNSPFEIAS